jgi:hypothetical protein
VPKNRIRHKIAMSTRSVSHVRKDSSEEERQGSTGAPVEIKIPQRMVNLPVIPSSILRNIILLVLALIALVAGGYAYFSLQQ